MKHLSAGADGFQRESSGTGSKLKILHTHKKQGALLEFLFFHALPVAFVIILFSLHLGQVFWRPPSPSSAVLNALQFAAKAHEALIVASISTILFHNIRYRLLASPSPGIPLGMVTAPFQISSISAIYLARSEFSSLLRQWRRLSSRDIVTAALIIYLFIITLLSGPSAAIAILPSLSSTPFPISFSQIQSETRGIQGRNVDFYKGAQFADLYPTVINASFINPDRCGQADLDCPMSAIGEVLKQFYGTYLMQMSDLSTSHNLTIRAEQTIRSKLLGSFVFATPATAGPDFRNQNFQVEVAYATTALRSLSVNMMLLTPMMGRWLRSKTWNWPIRISSTAGDSSGTYPWKQPFVTVHCSYGYHTRKPPTEAAYAGATTFGFVALDNSTISVKIAPGTVPGLSQNTTSKTIIIPAENLRSDPPIAFSSALAFQTSDNATTLCLITAQWLEAVETFVTLLQPGNIPNFAVAEPSLDLHQNASGILTLTRDWMETFDRGSSYFANLTNTCASGPENASTLDPACLVAGLSMGVAEGLSQVMDAYDTYYFGSEGDLGNTGRRLYKLRSNADLSDLQPFANITSDAQLANYTHVQFGLTHSVYAYRFGSVTVYLAFTVLFLYVTTVMTHMLMLLFGKTWSSTAWSSLSELLALALLSPEVRTKDAVVGDSVDRDHVWNLRASVEEIVDDKSQIRAALVVRHESESGAQRRLTKADRVYSYP